MNRRIKSGLLTALASVPLIAGCPDNSQSSRPTQIETQNQPQQKYSQKHIQTERPREQPAQERTILDYNIRLTEQLIRHEGYRERTYLDSRGIPTIGVGFNLTRHDAREKLEDVGANYDLVISKKQDLDRNQVLRLLSYDIETARSDARSLVRNYDSQPEEVKLIIDDMAFNLGRTRLSGFKKFISALERNDYKSAAAEMKDSRWFNQVGNRSRYLHGKMLKIADRDY
jgi:GH24 family phage-related lysozyme (muramidase)